ncbi:alpha/beta hydrolase [Ancylomarina sp. 16SWW S1-10-2]|uniref:alpha/beta hydrolase n=1 Tax=Ancylomarina sp. 16SWW S1-10-2 TaxID=2499681 RepID=UPI0012AE6D6D|nr:alpha/beta fold hydrolase [Ancylomarina sp. 16SWW S1-10-2]MRT93866.1 alpha/beta fold hydrolase [Ancylomarina sp. 16SWW S1-10-2]
MYYRKVVFVIMLLFLKISAYSQVDLNSINHTGFNYFSIQDTCETSECDSIRFIVKKKDTKPKPVIIFIQGSGNGSLIILDQNQSYSIIESLIPAECFEKYDFVLVSKPGVPICESSESSRQLWNAKRGDYKLFVKNDYKDYYVNAIAQVIDFLKKQDFVDSQKIYLVGHSQGSAIAAKIAAKYPGKVSKLVFMSGCIFDRKYQEINSLRQRADYRIITHRNAQSKIDSIYENYRDLKKSINYCVDTTNLDYYFYRDDYSFNFDPSLQYLLQFNQPTLVVYGSADQKSRELDLLPMFYTRANKDNLTFKCYPNYDHNYFEREYDTKGNILSEKFNWIDVFKAVDDWLSD